MKIVKMRITSVSPILMHNPAGMRGSSTTPQRGGKKIPEPMDEARSNLYILPSGQLYIKAESFREAGLIAASELRDPTRKGRATMTRGFAANVFLSKEFLPLERHNGKPVTENEKDWILDVRRVVVQKSGILRARPRIVDWACDLELEYDEDGINDNAILLVISSAGKYPGVLDYRVGKKGPFGRFKAELIDDTSVKTTKKAKRSKQSDLAAA
jgi:hypothetical protein